ncbi:MAG: putative protein YfgD [Candidatus Celerinatantimonas neptuna]|nr:MAG: putative protein YfgD [Candidatus Celerinatantimonas neptuna]
MTDIVIYHNPRCSKSRSTLTLLEDKGIKPTIIEYLKTPPTPETLKSILQKLDLTAFELLRRNEAVYKELDLANKTLSEEQLIHIMAENPKLIERPIIVNGEKAAIGRPPENVLKIL